jgi:ankyrin repeat protein
MGMRLTRFTVTTVGLLLVSATMTIAADVDLRLVSAAADQDKAAVRTLLKQGVNVNTARADGATALLFAAHWDDLETVDLLLKAGAKVNATDDHGVTPLARAAENASSKMVERLLKANADPNLAQMSGMTPLMIAAHTGSLEVVKSLIARGANVNATTTETRSSALMWAVAEPHPEIAKVLIEGRADVRAASNKGFTPLMFAAKNGDIEMAKMLIAAGVKVNDTADDGAHVLPYSIVSGQPAFAKFLLEQGADPNGEMGGVRALHTAAGGVDTWLGDWYRRHGSGSYLGGFVGAGRNISPADRTDLVKALVAKGADVNAPIGTSAMLMSYIGYPKKGAFEPFACGTGDLRGATALWVAAYTANGGVGGFGGDGGGNIDPMRAETSVDVIRALLDAGANQKIATVDGTTPFMAAAGLGRATFTPGKPRAARSVTAEEAVKVLFEAGAEINRVNEADFNALHGAAMRGLNEVIKYLVDNGADINARDFRGRTAYRLAEGSKQSFQFQAWPETAEYIKSLGANTRLGLAGTVQERLRDIGAAGQQQ